MKIQWKISLIFWNDFIFALISRHFIGLSRYFRLWKVMLQIKEPVSNKFSEIELKIQEIFFFSHEFLLALSLAQLRPSLFPDYIDTLGYMQLVILHCNSLCWFSASGVPTLNLCVDRFNSSLKYFCLIRPTPGRLTRQCLSC